MLTPEQRLEFESRGFVRLPRAVDPDRVATLRERVLAFVAQRGLVPEPRPARFILHPSPFAKLVERHGFDEVWGASSVALLDDLLGAGGWFPPKHAGQLLALVYPQPGVWPLPHNVWHLDYMAPGALAGIPGVQLFLFVDRVEPRSGATLAIAGSHRLVDALRRRRGPDFAGRSAEVRKALQREVPWLRELWTLRPGEDRIARFIAAATSVDGAELQVAEFTGEPGDVVAMHPWMLHAPSANCGDHPRMALTERVYARPDPR